LEVGALAPAVSRRYFARSNKKDSANAMSLIRWQLVYLVVVAGLLRQLL
jgi:hypothetical protein